VRNPVRDYFKLTQQLAVGYTLKDRAWRNISLASSRNDQAVSLELPCNCKQHHDQKQKLSCSQIMNRGTA
jgi:hypothetical protein